jgi:hypothetical protein
MPFSALLFLVPLALAAGLIWFARKAADATEHNLPPWPEEILHTWVAGVAGIAGLYLLLCVPWLLLGAWGPAAAGALVATLILALTGRDILDAIRGDLRRHREQGRGWFGHRLDCPGHPHLHRRATGKR